MMRNAKQNEKPGLLWAGFNQLRDFPDNRFRCSQ
tara:strand:+ start:3198 stop:3299 length:102 start_codon:yes stop_codon:yes gene_type:complete